MTVRRRLVDLELLLGDVDEVLAEERRYWEFQDAFEACAPGNKAMIDELASAHGTRDARRLLVAGRGWGDAPTGRRGDLAHKLGGYCRFGCCTPGQIYVMPGAKVIWYPSWGPLAPEDSTIIPIPEPASGGHRFLELIVLDPPTY